MALIATFGEKPVISLLAVEQLISLQSFLPSFADMMCEVVDVILVERFQSSFNVVQSLIDFCKSFVHLIG